jgi:hypothetical protein
MASTTLRRLWIDGQNLDGSDAGPCPLELRRDDEGKYRWYVQSNETGAPAGACDEETGVSGETMAEALDAAWASWGGQTWKLRTQRPGTSGNCTRS